MKRHIFLTLIVLVSAALNVKAERYYYFDHLTTTDGLQSNTIYCTMQDCNGFIWIGTKDGLSRYDGNSFRKMTDLAKGEGISGNVYAVNEDAEGKIWFSNPDGIHVFNPMTDRIESLDVPGETSCFSIQSDTKGKVWVVTDKLFRYDCRTLDRQAYEFTDARVLSAAIDSYGTIWTSLSDGSIHIYDSRSDKFIRRPFEHKIRNLVAAEEGKLIMTTVTNEVMYVDCVTLRSETIFQADKGNTIRNVTERIKGECWIGTQQGLYIRRSGTDYKGIARHNPATPESISADYITSLNKDRSGNVWVGTYYTGLNIWKDRGGEMDLYFTNPSDNSLNGKIVRSICQDESGFIWLCTEDGWLNRFNPTSKDIKSYKLAEDLNLHGLVIDRGNMWICSYGKGIWLFDLNKEKVIRHYDLSGNMVTAGIKSRSGQIYAGTTRGLYRYDREKDTFSRIESIGSDFVHSLYQDSNGIIWAGTHGNGIKCLEEDGTLLCHLTTSADNGALPSRFITSITEDSRHRIWVTTEGGGACHTDPEYELESIRFNTLTTEDGLPSNVTCAVAEDQDGAIWISTTNGLVSLSGDDNRILELINGNNELTGYQFSYGAICTTGNGVFYLGNSDGMVSLVPSKIKNRSMQEKLIITDILARDSDHSFSLCADGRSAMITDNVEVKHKNAASIYIRFVSPEYTDRSPLYSYRISRGKDNGFSGTTNSNNVMFTGLRAGKYRFEVSIVGKEDVPECTRTLDINIKPHPLLSKVALTIYALIFIGILAVIIMMFEMKRKRDKARQISKITSRKEKEIYNAKINFFTNITHEIRTPLTLIKMPIDKIISSGAYNTSNEKDLRIIQANTDRLLNLTNQLLDMRKMENNEISISFIKEDICSIVRKVMMLFEQMAAEQHITINSEIPEMPLYTMCAKDSIFSIVSNLMSNAIKYGDGLINVKVGLTEDQQSVVIRVESNGEIIPERDRENIFKLFFQREEAEKGVHGTGLGLPYARTLANMHEGRLYLDETVVNMNSFVFELPVKQEDITIEPTPLEADTELPEFDSSRHTVLIAEDSAEMRRYLSKEISAEYNVLTAANGADALEILHKEKVDLVISDIMMPIMDGCELCNTIKTDSDLSHVPIILLTAAVGVETRIETLESGADGYIEKPFPIELLMSNITNLFRNKEISYKQFINKPLTHYKSVTTNKVDQNYMDKVHEFIMEHISEPDLNIESLTIQIGTSKSSLYRKLKANTGLSINEYIRLCRLKQAAELLSSQKYKINEVAFMTGFSSPSYFATCFLKQFNITPSEFVKKLGQ